MTNINVGMSEICVSKVPGTTIIAPGLGSCIGLIMYDPNVKVAGMAHIVLPDSKSNREEKFNPGKFADTAVPELLSKVLELGASKHNLIVKISGGAQMFNLGKGTNVLNIGLRNTIAVKAALNKEGLVLKAFDTGGNRGRTVKILTTTGTVYVRCIGQDEVEL